jgi:hypothetical protein
VVPAGTPVLLGPGQLPCGAAGLAVGLAEGLAVAVVVGVVGLVVGAPLGVDDALRVGDALGFAVAVPVGVAVAVPVTVSVAVAVLVTVPAAAFGTVHTIVICWLSSLSTTLGFAVHVARSGPATVCATATAPPLTRATAARAIKVRFNMKVLSWGLVSPCIEAQDRPGFPATLTWHSAR